MKGTTNKRKIAASAAMTAASVALLMGLTFAWFTDSVTNTGIAIQAGTLDIKLTGEGDGGAILKSDAQWEPGYSEKATATLSNEGSLWLKYKFQIDNLLTAGDADLAEVLDVYVVDPDATNLDDAELIGTVAGLAAGEQLGEAGVLCPKSYTGTDAHASKTFSLVVKMRESAGNEYQGCGISFDVTVKATQTAVELDGFGSPNYDMNAPFPMNDEEIKNAITNDAPNVSISSDIEISRDNSDYQVTSDKVIDFNGSSVTRVDKPGGYFTIGEIGGDPVNVTVKKAHFASTIDDRGAQGAVRVEGTSAVTFEDCSFSGHADDIYAEAFTCYSTGPIKLTFNNCTFDSKVVLDSPSGGERIDAIFNNCTFTGAFGRDAAVYTDMTTHGSATFNGCTIDIANASTGNVDGVNLALTSGPNEMVGTFNDTTIKVAKRYQASRGVPVGTFDTPGAKGRILIGEGCSFFYDGVEKVYDADAKSWVNKA